MPRMTPAEGIAAYFSSTPPTHAPPYDPIADEEAMMDLATGLIGAMLRLGLHSLSGPELGSRIPLVVTNVPSDIIRIFVDPSIVPYGRIRETGIQYIKKAREHVKLSALSYQGDGLILDTATLPCADPMRVAAELQYQASILERRMGEGGA